MMAVVAALLLGVTPTLAQETAGAGHVELGLFPGGGLFFIGSHNGEQPFFGNYVVGGSAALNVNKWIGVEAEIAVGIGVQQSFTFNSQSMLRQTTPYVLNSGGTLLMHPVGSDRPFAPYAAVGIGGLTSFHTQSVDKLGVSTETFLTHGVGGGLKWFSSAHYGLRADYRLIFVHTKDSSTSFFGSDNAMRYAHRVYGGFVITY
jgi:hypothetical protein